MPLRKKKKMRERSRGTAATATPTANSTKSTKSRLRPKKQQRSTSSTRVSRKNTIVATKKNQKIEKKKRKGLTRRRPKKRSSSLPPPPPRPSSHRRRSRPPRRRMHEEYESGSEGSDGSTFLHSEDDSSFLSSNNSSATATATATAAAYRDHNRRRRNDIREVLSSRRPSPASPLDRVISGQKKSAAIAQAATWEATHLREQATAMEKRFLVVSSQLKESMQREQSLKMGRSRDKLATKELRYRNLYLAKELAQVKDLAKEASAKTRAKMHGMANSLNTLEEATAARSRGVQREVRHLRGLLTSLQRRAVRGLGPAGFSSGERILTAMWQAIETVYQIGVPGGSPMQSRVSSRRPYFSIESDSKKSESADEQHHQQQQQQQQQQQREKSTNEVTHDLAETMDGIVGDLERENQRLRAEVEMLQTEILHYKGKTESVALIPQYRQAVIRAREHAELLRQRLREEIHGRSSIQEELAHAQEEVRKLGARTASQTKRTMETEKELAVTHLRTAYVSQAMDSTKQQYQDAYTEFASTTMQQQQVIEELQDVVTAQRHQLEELSSVPATGASREGGGGLGGIGGGTAGVRVGMNMHRKPPPPPSSLDREIGLPKPRPDDDLLMMSSDSESYDQFENNSGMKVHDNHASGYGAAGTMSAVGTADTGSLSVLHSDLAKLDAEIAVLQHGIVQATQRQTT